ncbi:hypothetical protein [Metapseudomonas otitidis]|uniref:hypothetical protein n=1 Tax=Metapseudomonas otitidis TaxID=319939 RepID=UPI000D1A5A44|nr:hypothetical protein [Pseudomonas otitidis]
MSAFLSSRWLAWGLWALGLVGFGAWMAGQFYRPRLDEARAQLVALQQADQANRLALLKQGEAMAELERQGRTRSERAEAAVAEARSRSARDYHAAAQVMLEPTSSADACEAARWAFAEELRRERAP